MKHRVYSCIIIYASITYFSIQTTVNPLLPTAVLNLDRKSWVRNWRAWRTSIFHPTLLCMGATVAQSLSPWGHRLCAPSSTATLGFNNSNGCSPQKRGKAPFVRHKFLRTKSTWIWQVKLFAISVMLLLLALICHPAPPLHKGQIMNARS